MNYLTNGSTLKSWLLTKDHKRIALMYLVSVSAFFMMGGLYAAAIRLELLTPNSDLLESGTYNKVFTQHGILMIFFFLIPSIPAILGNFLIPIMIGAKDMAFPKLNIASWYVWMIGAVFAGPGAAMLLAELGASVVKLEPIGGDQTRRLLGSGAGFFGIFNRNKKSLCIDIKSPEGMEIAHQLIRAWAES